MQLPESDVDSSEPRSDAAFPRSSEPAKPRSTSSSAASLRFVPRHDVGAVRERKSAASPVSKAVFLRKPHVSRKPPRTPKLSRFSSTSTHSHDGGSDRSSHEERVTQQRRAIITPTCKALIAVVLVVQLVAAIYVFVWVREDELKEVDDRNRAVLQNALVGYATVFVEELRRGVAQLDQWRLLVPGITSAREFDTLFNRPLVRGTVAYVERVVDADRDVWERDVAADLNEYFNATLVAPNITDAVFDDNFVTIGGVVSPRRAEYFPIKYAAPPFPPSSYLRDLLSGPRLGPSVFAAAGSDEAQLYPHFLAQFGPNVVAGSHFAVSVVSPTNSSLVLGTMNSIMFWQTFVPSYMVSSAAPGAVRLDVYDVTGDMEPLFNCETPRLFGGVHKNDGSWALIPANELTECPSVSDLSPEDSVSSTIVVPSRTLRVVLSPEPGFGEEVSTSDLVIDSGFLIVSLVMVVVVLLNMWLLMRHMNRTAAATERHVLELTATENDAIQAKEHRDQFLAFLSHELRNPLFGLHGTIEESSEMVGSCEDATLRGELNTSLSTLRDCAEQIERTLNTVVNVQNMTTGKLVLKERTFSTRSLVQYLQQRFAERAQIAHVHLEFMLEKSFPAYLHGDRSRILELLEYLLGNAIDVSPAGGTVSCTASVRDSKRAGSRKSVKVTPLESIYENEVEFSQRSRRESDNGGDVEVCFVVRDQGRGMTAEQIERAFQPYTRERIERACQGRGSSLGLPTTKLLCEQMRGSVRVRSTPGCGSEFVVLLMLRAARAPLHHAIDVVALEQDAAQSAPVSEGSAEANINFADFQGRLLVVDDQRVNRRLVSRVLCKLMPQAEVDLAENGAQAVEAARRHSYACIFMDIQMPVMNGIDATRQLRRDGFAAPVIAVTGGALAQEVFEYRTAGMDDVIHKPCKRQDFELHLAEHWPKISAGGRCT